MTKEGVPSSHGNDEGIRTGFERMTFDNTARLRTARREVEQMSPTAEAWKSVGASLSRSMEREDRILDSRDSRQTY